MGAGERARMEGREEARKEGRVWEREGRRFGGSHEQRQLTVIFSTAGVEEETCSAVGEPAT